MFARAQDVELGARDWDHRIEVKIQQVAVGHIPACGARIAQRAAHRSSAVENDDPRRIQSANERERVRRAVVQRASGSLVEKPPLDDARVVAIPQDDLADGSLPAREHQRRIFELPASEVFLVDQNPCFIEEIQHPCGRAAEAQAAEIKAKRLHVDHIAAQHVLLQRNRVARRKMGKVAAALEQDPPTVQPEIPVLETEIPEPEANRTLVGRTSAGIRQLDGHAIERRIGKLPEPVARHIERGLKPAAAGGGRQRVTARRHHRAGARISERDPRHQLRWLRHRVEGSKSDLNPSGFPIRQHKGIIDVRGRIENQRHRIHDAAGIE